MERLREQYNTVIIPKLKTEFGFVNILQTPKVVKVVVNVGIGKFTKDGKMVDKIVEGQIRKFLAENCLLEQAFVKNPDLTVGAYVKECAKKAGGDLTIKRFTRYELGAGIEKKQVDFAAEVAAQSKGH